MNTQNDGGQAFAQYRTDPWGNPVIENGMTLRDYFAAKALSGILARQQSRPSAVEGYATGSDAHYARASYNYADAMLAERAK